MRIYKFLIQSETSVKMPQDAEILSVGVQDQEPYLWAAVDPEKPIVERDIRAYITGEEIEGSTDDWKIGTYIGSAHEIVGWMVVHVFDLGEIG